MTSPSFGRGVICRAAGRVLLLTLIFGLDIIGSASWGSRPALASTSLSAVSAAIKALPPARHSASSHSFNIYSSTGGPPLGPPIGSRSPSGHSFSGTMDADHFSSEKRKKTRHQALQELHLQESRREHQALKQRLMHQLDAVHEREDQLRKASDNAALADNQLRLLQTEEKTLKQTLAQTQASLALLGQQQEQNQHDQSRLIQQKNQQALEVASLLPAARQMDIFSHPENGESNSALSLLAPLPVLPSTAFHSSAPPPTGEETTLALSLLRAQAIFSQEKAALIESKNREIIQKQEALTEEAQKLKTRQEQEKLGQVENKARAEKATQAQAQAQQNLEEARKLLALARQNSTALNAEIAHLSAQQDGVHRRIALLMSRNQETHNPMAAGQMTKNQLALKIRALQGGASSHLSHDNSARNSALSTEATTSTTNIKQDAETRLARQISALSTGQGLRRGYGSAPVQGGILFTRWKEPTTSGAATGLTYKAGPGAIIYAPCAGRVLFSGHFRSFGQMVILDCGKSQRFVLSGFGKITSSVGQIVSQKARLGTMPFNGGFLFVQLHYKNTLVDPTPYLHMADDKVRVAISSQKEKL